MQEWNDCEAATENKCAGFGKKQQEFHQEVATIVPGACMSEPGFHQSNASAERYGPEHHRHPRFPTWPGLKNQRYESSKNEELCQFGLRPHRDGCKYGKNSPKKRIIFVGAARKLVRGNRNDRNDSRADRVEERLHPPQTTISNVSQRDRNDHQERQKRSEERRVGKE